MREIVHDALEIINALRKTEKAIEVIYMNGGCYRFHLFLKDLSPQARPLISNNKDHVITEIDGRHFDVAGEVEPINYRPLEGDEIEMAQDWSFSKSRMLSIGRCEFCCEPILTGF
jgi:hypothetical protein